MKEYLALALLALAACTQTADGSSDENMMSNNSMEDSVMEVDNMESYSGTVLAGTATQYLDFTQQDYEKALNEKELILLNFYANWCPVCAKEQPEAFAAFNSLDNPNVIGFRVNYKDSETDDSEVKLAKKYGIAYQHTKVILKNGERVLKAPDSWDSQRYIDEITGVLSNG